MSERAVHTFTVTIESDEDDMDLIAGRIGTGWAAVYDARVEWVHSRFPSGMMAYPKRDA